MVYATNPYRSLHSINTQTGHKASSIWISSNILSSYTMYSGVQKSVVSDFWTLLYISPSISPHLQLFFSISVSVSYSPIENEDRSKWKELYQLIHHDIQLFLLYSEQLLHNIISSLEAAYVVNAVDLFM